MTVAFGFEFGLGKMSNFRADLSRIFKIEVTHVVETNARKKNSEKKIHYDVSYGSQTVCKKVVSGIFFSN